MKQALINFTIIMSPILLMGAAILYESFKEKPTQDGAENDQNN